MSERKIVFADQLRGVAACSVVLEHAAYAAPTFLQTAILQFPLSLGQFGVALFFLISGFVIPISVRKYRVFPFLAARALRIYPTYMAGFSVTIACLYASSLLFGSPLTGSVTTYLQYFLLVRDFFGPLDLDPIVWTLLIELKFYVLCCLAAPWLRGFSLRIFSLPFIFGAGCAALTTAIVSASELGLGYAASNVAAALLLISFMLIGTAFFYHFSDRISMTTLLLLIAGLFAAFRITWSLGPTPQLAPLTTSYGVALLLFAGCYLLRSKFRGNRVTAFFSDISYPLYVVHAGVITLVVKLAILYRVTELPAVATGVGLSIAVAYLIHWAIENPTHRLGQAFARRNIR